MAQIDNLRRIAEALDGIDKDDNVYNETQDDYLARIANALENGGGGGGVQKVCTKNLCNKNNVTIAANSSVTFSTKNGNVTIYDEDTFDESDALPTENDFTIANVKGVTIGNSFLGKVLLTNWSIFSDGDVEGAVHFIFTLTNITNASVQFGSEACYIDVSFYK